MFVGLLWGIGVRSFERDVWPLSQVPGPVTRALARIDVGRGSEALRAAQLPGLLGELALRARDCPAPSRTRPRDACGSVLRQAGLSVDEFVGLLS
jgi:hypothetical protein